LRKSIFTYARLVDDHGNYGQYPRCDSDEKAWQIIKYSLNSINQGQKQETAWEKRFPFQFNIFPALTANYRDKYDGT